MTFNQDLLKQPFSKISIRDLVQNHAVQMRKSPMVWIQGNLKSSNGVTAKLEDAENSGFSITVTSIPTSLKSGQYCQCLGEITSTGEIRAIKAVVIESSLLKEMWSYELQDFKRAALR